MIRLVISTLFLAAAATASAATPGATDCVPAGKWVATDAKGHAPVASSELLVRAARQRVVLLGEVHDDPEHHRWQLQVIAGLNALRPDMVLGFEMFPRRAQPVLDRWAAGELTEAQFLKDVEWGKVWDFDPALYMPIFHFARMNRIPMIALNVDRELTRMVAEKGWDAVPEPKREGVGKPAPPTEAYLRELWTVHAEHKARKAGHGAGGHGQKGAEAPKQEIPVKLDDPEFLNFVASMQTWDRAMAEGLLPMAKRERGPLVVAIAGSGHLRNRNGIPFQLAELGVPGAFVLLPLDDATGCAGLDNRLADAVFGARGGKPGATGTEPPRPRLGVTLNPAKAGVEIGGILPDSVAERSGLKKGDLILRIAGAAPKDTSDVSKAVRATAPGTWLPIRVKRGDEELEIVARFPPAAE